MKGPNPAPLPPPLYSHYAADPDRRTHAPDRRPIPQSDLADRDRRPPPDLLDRGRPMPQPGHLDRRAVSQSELLDRLPPPDRLDRRPMPLPDHRIDLLDRRAMPQPDLLDRRMIAPPDGLERRTIALSDGSIRTYFALPPDPPPFARAYNVLDRLPLPHPNLAVASELRERECERSSQRQSTPTPTPNSSKDDRDSERTAAAGPSAVSKRKHEQDEEPRYSKREKTGGSRDKDKEKDKDEGEKGKAPLVEDKKALLYEFLKMSKIVNDSSTQKKNYLSEGRNAPLRCIVCESYRRDSKDFVDVNALVMHAYNVMNPEPVKHRALHKALCVLMGWDPSIEPNNSKGYQRLSPDQAQTSRDDLILWPPTVVIQNTNSSVKKDFRLEGMGNQEMDAKLLDLGFTGGKSKSLYGREGHQGVTLVRFSETLDGLKEAERLSQLFEKTGQGRKNWNDVKKANDNRTWIEAKENNRSSDKAVNTSNKNPNLVKEYGSGEKQVLYGYLATASDLEIFDSDAKKRASVRSRKESHFS